MAGASSSLVRLLDPLTGAPRWVACLDAEGRIDLEAFEDEVRAGLVVRRWRGDRLLAAITPKGLSALESSR